MDEGLVDVQANSVVLGKPVGAKAVLTAKGEETA